MGQTWFRQGEIADTDNTPSTGVKKSKLLNAANDESFEGDYRLAA